MKDIVLKKRGFSITTEGIKFYESVPYTLIYS
jgi:hypothetical protein